MSQMTSRSSSDLAKHRHFRVIRAGLILSTEMIGQQATLHEPPSTQLRGDEDLSAETAFGSDAATEVRRGLPDVAC